MRVKRYRPDFFTGYDHEYAEVDTVEELEQIPWVKGWMDEKKFHRLSVSDNRCLMAEMDEGYTWWVVAALLDAGDFGLPVWEPKERKQ